VLDLSAPHALAESFGALAIGFSLRHLECLVRKTRPLGGAPAGAYPASGPDSGFLRKARLPPNPSGDWSE
jgi:hypothetical protein